MSDRKVPFCASPRARACFEAWRARLEGLGVELGDADAYPIAIAASREAALDELQAEVRRTRDLGLKLKLIEAARRASIAFQVAMELIERTFGARVGTVAALPVAVGGGSARVIPMPLRPPDRLAPRNKGEAAVRARLLTAIANAEAAGRPPTKDALAAGVQGDSGTILRVLSALVHSGEVRRLGRGSKGSPYRYVMGIQR